MHDEFAVSDGKRILYQSEGFQMEQVTDTVSLSEGKTLLICYHDQRILEQRLQEAEEAIAAKDTFLSNMSHDIRTPMNAIVGLTLLAKMHLDETPRVADALNKIETASGHLLSLINDVLDMSRINSGRLQFTPEAFFLNDLIHETLMFVRPQALKKKQSLQLTAEEIAVESLIGDSLRLRQIFVNIISNAVKYTPEEGEISVRFSEEMTQDRCTLVFTCQDNGIGMSEEFLQRIFEPFERVHSSTVSRIEGTGLGMSIVKKLTEAMNGAISIQSRPQEGTTVQIRIPLDYQIIPVNADAMKDQRVLVVETDAALRCQYDTYLTEFRIEHVITDSVQAALDALADADIGSRPFHAVIIGQSCGEKEDKLDFAAYLHKHAPALPLLLSSNDDWEQIRYQAEQSGIVSFLPLPLFRKSLIQGLEAVLKSLSNEKEASAYPDLKGKKLLLVEDNFINQEIALEILGATGAQIDVAENGSQAVERFIASPENGYALILMDVQMPVMNGYQATEQIRGSGRTDAATVPIYAMTANTFAEDIARARSAGMNGHIAKPIDISALMQVLRTALGR